MQVFIYDDDNDDDDDDDDGHIDGDGDYQGLPQMRVCPQLPAEVKRQRAQQELGGEAEWLHNNVERTHKNHLKSSRVQK